MTGPLLRSVSVVLLSALLGVSAARAVCLLPCLIDEASAAGAAHCAPEGTAATRVSSTTDADCGDCARIGLEHADRLPSRNGLTAQAAQLPATLPQLEVMTVAPSASAFAEAPPGPPSPARAPLPLRI